MIAILLVNYYGLTINKKEFQKKDAASALSTTTTPVPVARTLLTNLELGEM